MIGGAQNTLVLKHLIECLVFAVRWGQYNVSSVAGGMAPRESVRRVRHALRSLWTQRALREHGLNVRNVETRLNAADLVTTHVQSAMPRSAFVHDATALGINHRRRVEAIIEDEQCDDARGAAELELDLAAKAAKPELMHGTASTA